MQLIRRRLHDFPVLLLTVLIWVGIAYAYDDEKGERIAAGLQRTTSL